MTVQSSRRAFLRGAFSKAPAMRPPGAQGEMQFANACTGCGGCIAACPDGLLVEDRNGQPVVTFAEGACSFCSACVDACGSGALSADRAWAWRAEAGTACLSLAGVQCRACQDHCDAQAIRFRPIPGGKAQPLFDTDTCTGCGACVAPCPVDAIRFVRIARETEIRPC